MKVMFDLANPLDRRRVRNMLDAEDRREADNAPVSDPAPRGPKSGSEFKEKALRRLVKSKTGKLFLRPAAEKLGSRKVTAAQIDGILGFTKGGVSESYLRIIGKFVRRHGELRMADLFEVHDETPRAYTMTEEARNKIVAIEG